MAGNRLVILDRDGVLNEDSDAYIKSPAEWIPLPGSAEAVARLNQAGHIVVVATNQSGLARGYFDLETLAAIHERMQQHLEQHGAHLDGIYVCPHGPDDRCTCRKPRPGLLDQIASDHGDPAGAPLVGDSLRDLQAGVARHCAPVLVLSGKGQRTLNQGLPDALGPVAVHSSLAHFVDHFLSASS